MTEPRWLDADQQRAWRALVLGTQLLFDKLDEELRRAHGLSLIDYEILVRLSESEGELRMAQLASALAHSRSRVTHNVSRLEAAGLVSRCGSPTDGRGVVCQMTPAGWDRLRTAAPTHVEGVREHLVDLADPEDFLALGRVMNAACDDLIGDQPAREMR